MQMGLNQLPILGKRTAKAVRGLGKDAWHGLVEIGHNSLAVLGLAAVVGALFLSSESVLREQIERQALDWLNTRHSPGEANRPSADDILASLAEPDAIARATAANPAALSRPQAQVATWISRRYRVAPEPIARLVQEAWLVGKKANLDPTVILAIMAIESGFNPFAQSHVGAQGLMQVMTHVHDDKYEHFGGRHAAFDPVTNLRVGVRVLEECISRAGGSIEAGLKYYVGAANLPDDGGYAERVMTEHANLRAVAEGKTVPLNAPTTKNPVTPGVTPVMTAQGSQQASAQPVALPSALAALIAPGAPSAPQGAGATAGSVGQGHAPAGTGAGAHGTTTAPAPAAAASAADKASTPQAPAARAAAAAASSVEGDSRAPAKAKAEASPNADGRVALAAPATR